MHLIARQNLARFLPADGQSRLLLEGAWCDDSNDADDACSLDALIDARHDWIDAAASSLTEQCLTDECRDGRSADSFLFVNALRLRYAMVKWLRVLAWRRLAPAKDIKHLTLHLSTSKDDEEYVTLWNSVARAEGVPLQIRRHDIGDSQPGFELPPNAPWRRTLASVAANRVKPPSIEDRSPRVLFCGNPTLLGPPADELQQRRAPIAWLFDRFAVRPWLRWGVRGAAILTCDSVPDNVSLAEYREVSPLEFDGVDLAPTVAAWRAIWSSRLAAAQQWQRRQVARHLATFRPTNVIVDEDATPLPRIVLAEARGVGAASTVIQHGACGIRFGFTPLLADRIVVNNDGSRRQLERWGVAPQRIVDAGSTRQRRFTFDVQRAVARRRKGSGRTFLLICTTPPRDDRPDAVTYHLTSQTHEDMLMRAFIVAAEAGDATLVVRPHPRTTGDAVISQLRRRFPALKVRVSNRRERLAKLAGAADVILSCASSAGIEIAQAGRPVIQLLPAGSGEILPADWYGLVGSARTLDELRDLLRRPSTSSAAKPGNDDIRQLADTLLGVDRRQTQVAQNPRSRESAHA